MGGKRSGGSSLRMRRRGGGGVREVEDSLGWKVVVVKRDVRFIFK